MQGGPTEGSRPAQITVHQLDGSTAQYEQPSSPEGAPYTHTPPCYPLPATPIGAISGNSERISIAAQKNDAPILKSITKGVAKAAGYTLNGVGVVGAFVGAAAFSGLGGEVLKWPAMATASFSQIEGAETAVEEVLSKSGTVGGIAGGYLFSMASAKLLAYANDKDYKQLLEAQREFNKKVAVGGDVVGHVGGILPGLAAMIVTAPVTLLLGFMTMGLHMSVQGVDSGYEWANQLGSKKKEQPPASDARHSVSRDLQAELARMKSILTSTKIEGAIKYEAEKSKTSERAPDPVSVYDRLFNEATEGRDKKSWLNDRSSFNVVLEDYIKSSTAASSNEGQEEKLKLGLRNMIDFQRIVANFNPPVTPADKIKGVNQFLLDRIPSYSNKELAERLSPEIKKLDEYEPKPEKKAYYQEILRILEAPDELGMIIGIAKEKEKGAD